MKLNEMKPLIIAHDMQSKRNVEAILALYDAMIEQKTVCTGDRKNTLVPDYIQHNPIIPTTAKALGEFFNSGIVGARKNLCGNLAHRVIASGDWGMGHAGISSTCIMMIPMTGV